MMPMSARTGTVRPRLFAEACCMTPPSPAADLPSLPTDLLQQIVDAAGPIVYIDAEQRCRFVNHSGEEWLGQPRHQIEGRCLEEILGEAAYAAIRPHVAATLAGQRVTFEWAIPAPSGGSRQFHVTHIPHHAPDGTVDGFFAMAMEVTGQQAANGLHASEVRYRELWENSQDILYTLDLDARLTDVNRQVERLTGYTRAELLGRPIADLILPAYHDVMRTQLARKMAGEPVTTYEIALRTRGVRNLFVEVSSRLIRDATGRPVGVQGSARDVTARVELEAELRTGEERLRLAAEAAGFGMYDDRGPGQVYWSPELRALFGLPADALPEEGPRTALEFIHPDDRERWRAALEVARDPAGSGMMTVEHRVLRPDGRVIWVAQSGRILFEGEGVGRRGVRAIGIVADITARKEAEAARDAALAEVQAVLASAADAITAQDPGGRLVYANAAAARLLGFASVEALLAAPFSEVIGQLEMQDEHGQSVLPGELPGQLALQGEPAPEALIRFRVRATGQERWAIVRAAPVRDAAGRVQLAVNAFQDITPLRRADELERRLAAIVASSEDAIIGKTLDAEITDWNAAAERMYGYSAAEAIGQRIAMLVPADRPDELTAIMARLRRGEPISHFETMRVRKDGVRLDVALSISPIRNSGGELVGAATIARDITVQKRAEAEREELLTREQAALAEARAALAVRDEFLASVSHDLRTPLTGIRGLAQLLARRLGRLDAPQTQQMVEQATAINRAAGTMAAMVDELLDLTRLEAGQPLELRREAVDLVALAQARAREHGRTASRHPIQVTADAPALVGQWDPGRLERVLDNILSNAVKYSPDGGEVVVTIRPAVGPGGPWAELAVADHGVGIPAADLPHIFERFRRGANVVGQVVGAGLGLAGVRRIVEHHGGTNAATSTEGVGTTITVRLPLADLAGMEPATADA
jgi:PAS domain S-box-containing protein